MNMLKAFKGEAFGTTKGHHFLGRSVCVCWGGGVKGQTHIMINEANQVDLGCLISNPQPYRAQGTNIEYGTSTPMFFFFLLLHYIQVDSLYLPIADFLVPLASSPNWNSPSSRCDAICMIWVYSKLSDGEVNSGCTYRWSNRFLNHRS